jgi:glycosyltransferase involved in cell wall biosynthesis
LESTDRGAFDEIAYSAELNVAEDMIMSHGCWRYPTRWGAWLGSRGFVWMAVPHGMLEPWSLSQKRLRKWVYFFAREKALLNRSSICRAVSEPEARRLSQLLRAPVHYIPNAVSKLAEPIAHKPPLSPRNFLFLGRLHHKKGLMELLQAWESSEVWLDGRAQLTIAGPDDGEATRVSQFVAQAASKGSVYLHGKAYGGEKDALLRRAHFFLLPSHSEGFPTSILEAMQYGMVPLISEGCNFPQLHQEGVALLANPCRETLMTTLRDAMDMNSFVFEKMRLRAQSIVREQFSTEVQAEKLVHLMYSHGLGHANI